MISVILNVYKRPYLLEKQIEAIKNQTVKIESENIHVWYNKSDIQQYYPIDKKIKTYVCNWNTKFWGRFTIPLYLKSEYIAVFDDDIIPQINWLSNCLETIENDKFNGILGGSGVILNEKSYYNVKKIGWNGIHNDNTVRVDLVGHAWFFRQEWIKYLWYEKPITFDNGEDIMFSYLAKKYGNINTFVPPHPDFNETIWCTYPKLSMEYGNDENATWLSGNHYNVRSAICKYCIDNGWLTVNDIK